MLQERLQDKALAPQAKRDAVGQMVEIHHSSKRRACRLVGLSRDSCRHPPQMDAQTQQLSERIVGIAHARRRFGYRRIHDLIHPEFPAVPGYRFKTTFSNAFDKASVPIG